MTPRRTKKWHIMGSGPITTGYFTLCAAPKATNKDLIAYCEATLPSRATHRIWTVHRAGARRPYACTVTRGYQHYIITYEEEIFL